jgi:hypothetical protein
VVPPVGITKFTGHSEKDLGGPDTLLGVGSGRCHSYAREYCPPHGDEEVFVTRGRRRLRRSRLYQALLNLILSHQELNLYPFVGIINVDRHLPAIQMSDVAISDGIEFFGKQEVKTVLNR